MLKGFFLSVPSVSVYNTLTPVIQEIALSGYDIKYYNTVNFHPQGDHAFSFRAYPDYFNGYYSDRIDGHTSYFQFGEILIDTADSLMDFLRAEVEREKPDFIIHSHLAVWGKLLATYYKLPAITLYITFILDKRIMLPYFRKLNGGNSQGFDHVHDAMGFYRKSCALYNRLQIAGRPDLWDVYVNKGQLNISFILEKFQPQRSILGKEYQYVGYPAPVETNGIGKSVIYVAMGTIFNKDILLYRLCIQVLGGLHIPCIISVGKKVTVEELGPVPENITVVQYTDQQEVLKRTMLFITRGGMASVHEAIHTATPMIVIPLIPEQQLTAERIQELEIGIHIPASELTEQTLLQGIRQILDHRDVYVSNLNALLQQGASVWAPTKARNLVAEFLQEVQGGTTLIDLFIKQAESDPEAIAVRYKATCVTYKELHEQSNQLAHYLLQSGVKEEAMIPVFMGPGIDIIIAIIGIMKAGAAYVPVDPEYPEERVTYMLQDTGCRWIVSNSHILRKKQLKTECTIILLDEHRSLIEKQPVTLPVPRPLPHHLAYIMYTSGSTGTPKGVMIGHAQIYTYTYDVYTSLQLQACDSYAVLGTFSADAGLTAVFCALCFGKALHIINIKEFTGVKELAAYFEKFPVDCYKTTPSLLSFILQHKEAGKMLPLKRLILGGEACSWVLAHQVYQQLPAQCRLFNHYGPTETTVGVITYAFPADTMAFPELIPLGKPLPHVGAFILDGYLQPVRDGDDGELYIEGPLLARGYLNKPDLTGEKFITTTLLNKERRLYKTGDLVRRLPDGNIEYVGRMDDQVKIRGYRIELKEIESVILLSGMVKQCIVLVRENKAGIKYLAAYIIPAEGFNRSELINVIKKKLPDYMLPGKWVPLSSWPLTVNNKINRQALPDPEEVNDAVNKTGTRMPDSMEALLIKIWSRLLGVKAIGLQDNFFELGGDSLLLMKLSYELGEQYNIAIPATVLFECVTIEKLAAWLTIKIRSVPFVATNGLPAFDEMECSVTQKNLFIQNKLNPSESFPNSSLTFEITGSPDLQVLEAALVKIIAANESLHTAYFLEKGKVYKRIDTACSFKLQFIQCGSNDIDKEIVAITKPFHFNTAPLIRAFILTTPNERNYLHIDMPHINSDGESMKIIMQDMEAIYNNTPDGSTRLQFTDFQKKVYAYLHSEQYMLDEQFWKKQLDANIPLFNCNGARPAASTTFDGVFVVMPFPVHIAEQINGYVKEKGLTKFQLLLITYFLLLHRITAANDIAVMCPVHNRNEKALENIVGLLTNVVLVKTAIQPYSTVKDYIHSCRHTILQAIAHQQFPFEHLFNIWKGQGRSVKSLLQFFFGYHYNRSEYQLGNNLLRLHIPVKNRENLPLSVAVFETTAGWTMRASSNMHAFKEYELRNIVEGYFNILNQVMTNGDDRSIEWILKNQLSPILI